MHAYEFIKMPQSKAVAPPPPSEKFTKLTHLMSRYADGPALSRIEEARLIAEAKSGDKTALRRLTEAHLNFVTTIAKRTAYKRNASNLKDDLVSVAMDGFLTSVRAYKSDADVRLCTFSKYYITGACLRYIERNSRMLNNYSCINEITARRNRRQIFNEFKETHGRGLSLQASDLKYVAQKYNLTFSDSLKAGLFPYLYNDVPIDEFDIVSQEAAPEDSVCAQSTIDILDEALEVLRASYDSPRNYEIMMEFRRDPEVSVKEIATRYAISIQRVHVIRNSCLTRLKAILMENGIHHLHDIL